VVQDGRTLRALPTRDAVLPMLALLCMAHDRQSQLSALLADLPECYTASDRLQCFPVENSARLLEFLQHDHDAACSLMAPASGSLTALDMTDGLRATFSNGDIVHIRPSGNAPELRCYAESGNQSHAQRLCVECLRRIADFSAALA
jgi:phosphomannomutase